MRKVWLESKYLCIATRKRDGSWVNTPVWYGLEGDLFYLFSEGAAGKVKRIRNFPDVRICPCTVTGKPTGEWVEATATIIEKPDEMQAAHQSLVGRYGWQMKLLDMGSRLVGKINKRAFIKVVVCSPAIFSAGSASTG